MNRLIPSLCLIVLLINFVGCKRQPPTYTICMLDVSKSITPEGVQDEFKAMDDLVDQMHRDDRLTLIPITGDAMSETSGHILRFIAPIQREPYDHDLVVFRRQAHARIEAMQDSANAHPFKRTDILGTLNVAKQELEEPQESLQRGTERTMIVFSDFIEDDGVYRFAFDPSLASDASARGLAKRLKKEDGFALGDIRIRLRTLPSIDLRSMAPQRQKAIRAFWSDYLSAQPNTIPR